MINYKKYLSSIILLTTVLLLTACTCKNPDNQFPLNSQGYPKTDTILINGREYKIKDLYTGEKIVEAVTIEIEEDNNEIELVLPIGSGIAQWSINQKDILLDNYKRSKVDIKEELEGPSPYIQAFKFTSDAHEIILKHHNVNELDKAFSDIEEDYMLKLQVIYK